MSKKDEKKPQDEKQPAEKTQEAKKQPAEKKQDAKKSQAKQPEEKAAVEETPVTEAPAQEAAPEKSETEKLQVSLAEANDKYLRMLVEYDNYRRRSQKERESIYTDVRADTVTKFLPVYDNLSRAVQHEADEETRKGVEAIFHQFQTILTGLGVTEIEAVGKKFDPTVHEALLHIDDEKYGEGEIVLELEKGFKLGDKVIRFAKVQVAN